MDIKIRDHIKSNFKDTSIEEIKEAIEASIDNEDEVILPGMGVFFEIVWKYSDEEMKNQILTMIQNNV